MTNSRGVDVVLNSLSEYNLMASWESVATFGHFIEIGKRDIQSNNNFPMWEFNKPKSFSSVDLYHLFQERPNFAKETVKTVMDLLRSKVFHVHQPFQVFGVSELEDVLRRFQSGKNSGKMVVEMRDDDLVRTILDIVPVYIFNKDATFLISGGFGSL
ncbi:hypothetical protein B0J14DRAFT_507587 [Halenospora varia]|nr:hypothetical protein B0J14DRAFT_507587 [Halenospora varia]